MRKIYEVRLWEKESVWVRRTLQIESDKELSQEQIENMVKDKSIYQNVVDSYKADYCWETAELLDTDTQDLTVEELK